MCTFWLVEHEVDTASPRVSADEGRSQPADISIATSLPASPEKNVPSSNERKTPVTAVHEELSPVSDDLLMKISDFAFKKFAVVSLYKVFSTWTHVTMSSGTDDKMKFADFAIKQFAGVIFTDFFLPGLL